MGGGTARLNALAYRDEPMNLARIFCFMEPQRCRLLNRHLFLFILVSPPWCCLGELTPKGVFQPVIICVSVVVVGGGYFSSIFYVTISSRGVILCSININYALSGTRRSKKKNITWS